MTLISPEAINDDLLPALLTRDVDRVFEFLSTHVTDQQATAQMFQTMPRLVAALVEAHPNIARPDEDEMWAFEHLSVDPDAGTTMQARLVVAALNGDDETVAALVHALLKWPPSELEKALAGLMTTFIMVAESLPRSPDSGEADRG